MEQNLLEQAVVAIEDLPDDARNVLHALEFFPVFESAPQSYKLLLDYEPLRESLRFFVFMCDAITRNKEGQPPAYNSELGLRFLRRALSAAKGCLAVARHGRARPLNTMEELLNHSTQGEQDEQDEGGSEETYISILRNSWLVVHAVLIFCSDSKSLSKKIGIEGLKRLVDTFVVLQNEWSPIEPVPLLVPAPVVKGE